jgi:hypothetical protein
MIPGSANPLLLVSAAQAGGYAISRSLRFNSADSASLSLASYTGSGTFSCWVKRCKLGAAQTIISGVAFNASDQLNGSTAVFRDPSAWMHIVVSSSGTYVNGASVGSGTSITPSAIGSGCDLYLADVHFIDGQNLNATSFGAADTNGIWQPKAYTGTYPGNSFHLTFSDNSTAGSLGDDSSGNGNNWSVNNISVAAGAGNDSVVDVPTNGTETDTGLGGEVRGNYATLNPLATTFALSNGNLDNGIVGSGQARGTIAIPAGSKIYFEANLVAPDSSRYFQFGIISSALSTTSTLDATNSYSIEQNQAVSTPLRLNGSLAGSLSASLAGTVFQVAIDLIDGKLWLGRNNTWYDSSAGTTGNPATGANPTATISTTTQWFPAVFLNSPASPGSYAVNFGQRSWAYQAPAGFKALCTANLPSTTITTSGSYTGNGVADGPFVFLNGVPTAMTIGGNSVTFGTDADKLSNGFKIRTTSTTFNQNASTYNYSITSTGDPFKTARAQAN